jgi:hypothetical protein
MTKKLYAGKGAKATILTRMIKPRQQAPSDKNHRSEVVLLDQFSDSSGEYYCFRYASGGDGQVLHALRRWVRIEEEGEDLFDGQANVERKKKSFKEPKTKWKDSSARRQLYKDIKEGRVPLDATDQDGKSTMQLRDIYSMHLEYAEYDYDKFSSRLGSLRKIIKEKNSRAEKDKKAFDLFTGSHTASLSSAKGYIQWQGSLSQTLAKQDILFGKVAKGHDNYIGMRALYGSREEYYDEFPYRDFRDKIRQEIRTGKYLHTLKLKAITYQSS